MYRWSIDTPARPQFQSLPTEAKKALTDFMDAAVIMDPMEFRRSPNEGDRVMRSLPFGPHGEGLVTFLVYVRGDRVLIVQIQWHGTP